MKKFIIIILTIFFSNCIIRFIGGASSKNPEDLETNMSKGARILIDSAYENLNPEKLMDYHVHVVGIGTNESGAYVNSHMKSIFHPKENLRYRIYLSALGVKDVQNADKEAVERLVHLVKTQKRRGKYMLLAFDKHYRKDGTVDEERTEFYTPNNYVINIAKSHPEIFIPAISVHPYRKDSISELEKWGKEGVKLIKWLPNAQGMNPSDPVIKEYYNIMKKYGMALLTHAGEEKAVEAEEFQKLGNPLLLRYPLDLGVKVIVAHGASLGTNEDIDSDKKEIKKNFELFMRMMSEKKYNGLLFGETSAQVQFNRLAKPITAILKNPEIQKRLVNGSDYPLPAINIIIRTTKLVELGLISDQERICLNEIYDYNPLLFDFVLKRTIRTKSGEKLSPNLFLRNKEIF